MSVFAFAAHDAIFNVVEAKRRALCQETGRRITSDQAKDGSFKHLFPSNPAVYEAAMGNLFANYELYAAYCVPLPGIDALLRQLISGGHKVIIVSEARGLTEERLKKLLDLYDIPYTAVVVKPGARAKVFATADYAIGSELKSLEPLVDPRTKTDCTPIFFRNVVYPGDTSCPKSISEQLVGVQELIDYITSISGSTAKKRQAAA